MKFSGSKNKDGESRAKKVNRVSIKRRPTRSLVV